MSTRDLTFRFLGIDGGAGREFDKMAGKSAALEHAVGKMALGFAAAGVAIGVESVRAAAKFQTAMELIHTQAGRSQKTVDQMSKAVLAMSAGVATGPDELAKGLYHLASTGLSTAKSLQALKIAAEGAKLGGADLESVTNALNATLASGIKGAQNMSQAMGALNAVVGAGDMRMQDLADAMGTGVLAAVKGFGLSLNDVGAALATFGDNNIRGADAATQLRMAVLFMAKPAASAKATLKDLGLTSHTLANDMGKGGLGLALTDLHTRLLKAGDTGAKMGQVLLDMFGHKAGTGISILEQQFGRFQSKQEEVARGSKNFATSWTGYTQTFGYSWDRARVAFQTMTIEIGQKLLPTATKAMNWIGTTGVGDLTKFSGWVSRNKRPIEDIAKVLAAIAAFRFASSTLSKIPGLLGGGKGGGGLLGGGSKLAPVHVWVDNPSLGGGRGSPPIAGGSGVGTAERVGEGAAAEGVVARVATKVGLRGAARLAGPLYLTYLATQGGDQAPGQGGLFASGFKGSLTSQAGKNSNLVAKVLEGMLGAGASKFTADNGSYRTLNLSGATKDVLAGGNKTQIAALRQLSAVYPALAKEIKAYDTAVDRSTDSVDHARSSLAVFRANLLNQRAAVHDTIASLRTIPGAMAQIAAEARTAGLTIGQALDSGVTIGIKQGSGQIQIVSTQVIDGVRHSMMTRARASSPSKMTQEIGGFLAAGLALGLRSGKKGVGQAASQLIDTVRGNIMGAGSLGNVASMQDSLGASGGTSIAQILAFTGGQVAQDRAFARNLAVARKHGLSKSVAQQIAQLGPDQGAPLAASIAGASRSQIRRLNSDEASIGRLGSQIGGVVSMTDSSIAKIGRAVAQSASHMRVTVNLTEVDKRNGKRVLLAG